MIKLETRNEILTVFVLVEFLISLFIFWHIVLPDVNNNEKQVILIISILPIVVLGMMCLLRQLAIFCIQYEEFYDSCPYPKWIPIQENSDSDYNNDSESENEEFYRKMNFRVLQ